MSTTPSGNPLSQPVKIACIQLASGSDKAWNLSHAREKVLEASLHSEAKIVVLPECFNSPYGCEHFDAYAELIPEEVLGKDGDVAVDESIYPSFTALRRLSKEAGVYLVAGSIPEKRKKELKSRGNAELAEKKRDYYLYNTSMIFDPTGRLLGIHRKIHLFDIDIPGKITFTESSVLSPGADLTLIDIPPYGKIGVAICYDVRFPELAQIYARKGAFALVIPGAFNLTTGPLHWELLARSRAVDNQVYVALCSPARDEVTPGAYRAWGESMVVDPTGKVLKKVEKPEGKEAIIVVELKPEEIQSARDGIPVTKQRRWDVYADVSRVGPLVEKDL